ncbi:uncharacterized acetyltransferase At3g50280-like isoform X2 [Rutidosis leptorrhynchoides]|uniref:uncharacterized acetyltransferase At3g50280-like isoform X2 n=1 Tax=Rutidosis leptorrhynchoides TaxID=125765 RepID=UPI003A999EE8
MTSPKVQLISESLVKPLHQLSSDAKQPIHFTPFELVFLTANYSQKGLLFAKPSEKHQPFSITDFLNKLCHTLSATLTHFYPLTARLATQKQQNPPSYVIYIDPGNSPGVKFVYAKTDANISDVVTELTDGIFIGASVNHIVADGTSLWNFMLTWSEIFRSNDQNGGSISRPPVFKRLVVEGCDPIINLPYIHPDEFIERFRFPHLLEERFFDFSATSISKLKEKANAEYKTRKISSLQAVSALLWRCITRVRRPLHNADTVCKLAINNRRRLDPPLSDNYFGNPVQLVRGTASVEELMAHGLGWAALILNEVVRKHDDMAVKNWAQAWSKAPTILKMSELFEPNAISIVSSPRFDMYGCEFGLGKAVATRSGCGNKADGKITMFPGRNGGGSMGIEICLLPEYMMKIECDEEFTSALASN